MKKMNRPNQRNRNEKGKTINEMKTLPRDRKARIKWVQEVKQSFTDS